MYKLCIHGAIMLHSHLRISVNGMNEINRQLASNDPCQNGRAKYAAVVFLKQPQYRPTDALTGIRSVEVPLGSYPMELDEDVWNIRRVQDCFMPRDRNQILGIGLLKTCFNDYHDDGLRWQRLERVATFLFTAGASEDAEHLDVRPPQAAEIPGSGIGRVTIDLTGDMPQPCIYLPAHDSERQPSSVTQAVQLTAASENPIFAALRDNGKEIIMARTVLQREVLTFMV